MLKEGTFLGDRYEIIKQIGSGGMSDVYKAKCHKLNRFVAIKVLKQEYSEDKNFLMKFNVEAQSVAGLTHPNIVNIYDVGSDNGLSYIVMEYIEGITLKKYIEKKGRLGVKEAVSIAIQVAQGIEAAHNNQIIHRDIKPQNILISKDGKVKVTDFGIARAASANTINSNAMGSAHYISPEQARGGFVDEKSDIYSLGITLFEMITGSVPFEGDSTVTIALKHIQDELPSIDDFVDDIPVSVKKIVEKCTQKKPDRRYLKISSLIADLKKSLISPDEDFVQLIPINNTSSTVMISDDEVSAIKEGKKDDDSLELTDDDDEAEEESLDEVNPKLDKIITIGAIVAGVVILIIFILLCIKFLGGIDGCSSSKNKEQTTETSEMVTVPDLTGMTEDEATEALNELGLGIKTAYEQNNDVEEGKVISQSVDADSQVAKNTTITVTISQGKASVTVPDLVGKTKDEAAAALKALGLNNTIVTDYNDAAIDTVFQTNPGAGGTLKYGDSVELHVSRGPQSTKVSVPDLKGKTQAQAKAALEAAGLALGNVTTAESSSTEGTVIAQGYDANTMLEKNSKVDITLSSGSSTKQKSTKSFSSDEIKSYLASAGYTVKVGDSIKVVYSADSDSEIRGVNYAEGNQTLIQSVNLNVNSSTTDYNVKIYVGAELLVNKSFGF
jgi:serine/threonine protein kinase/beta-lactam-binding protein with PASTA domain